VEQIEQSGRVAAACGGRVNLNTAHPPTSGWGPSVWPGGCILRVATQETAPPQIAKARRAAQQHASPVYQGFPLAWII